MQLSAVADRVPEVADAGPWENVYVSPPPQQQHAEADDQLAGPRVHHADHTDVASVLLQSAAGGALARARDETLVSAGDRSVALPVQADGALRHRMVSTESFDIRAVVVDLPNFYFSPYQIYYTYAQPKRIHLLGLPPEGERLGRTSNG